MSPFLNIAATLAIFQISGILLSWTDFLKIMHNGFLACFWFLLESKGEICQVLEILRV